MRLIFTGIGAALSASGMFVVSTLKLAKWKLPPSGTRKRFLEWTVLSGCVA